MDLIVVTPRRFLWMPRAVLLLLLVCGVVSSHAQVTKTGSKEGTLIVNYYSTAPDPELEQLRQLAVDALGIHLRGEVVLTGEDIGWARSVKSLQREMNQIVTDLLSIRQFEGVEPFRGFSSDVLALLQDYPAFELNLYK